MPKLLITVGISNCGKSEYARKYIEQHPGTVEVCRDHFRYSGTVSKSEREISMHSFIAVADAIKKGLSVIISDTNLSQMARNRWCQIGRENNMEIVFVVFNTAFNNIFHTSSSNLFSLPDHVLNNQYPKFLSFLDEHQKSDVIYQFI